MAFAWRKELGRNLVADLVPNTELELQRTSLDLANRTFGSHKLFTKNLLLSAEDFTEHVY